MMLVVNQPDMMLGVLNYGKTHNFKYTIKNTFQDTLTIDKLVLGCGSCTKASVEKSVLEKGEETTINVAFTPGSTGINKKFINIAYSVGKGKHGTLTVTFKANVNA